MKARLLETKEIAPEIRHFVFDVPAVDTFPFTPGQFVSFSEDFEGKRITRAYSIASVPEGNRFELCLNRVKEGRFSPHLFAMRPGDEVDVKGPVGGFVARSPSTDSLFVAAGTGIAPIRGILLDLLPRDAAHQFTLLFGVRYEYGILYRDDFEELARRHPNFAFLPTLTRPDASWTGRTGRVQTHLEAIIGERRDLDIYICGLREMVDDVRACLKAAGFDRKRIVYEKYN
jgi:ferredoxin-NADP reductase